MEAPERISEDHLAQLRQVQSEKVAAKAALADAQIRLLRAEAKEEHMIQHFGSVYGEATVLDDGRLVREGVGNA